MVPYLLAGEGIGKIYMETDSIYYNRLDNPTYTPIMILSITLPSGLYNCDRHPT